MDESVYEASGATIFGIASDVFVATHASDQGAIELNRLAATLLRSVIGRKTLVDHARAAVERGDAADMAGALATLHQLCTAGLVRQSPIPPTTHSPPSRSRITTVAIITADRPGALRRCLLSLRHLTRNAYSGRILIVDGSRRPHHRQANVESMREVLAGVDRISYVSALDSIEVRRELVQRGASPLMVEWAFAGGYTGANRNLAALWTAGERVVLIDDDIVCTGWRDDPSQGIEVGGHADRRQWSFFTTRAEAIAIERGPCQNLLEAHGDLLGRTLGELAGVTGGLNFSGACAHLLSLIAEGTDPTVRVTMAGLAGDAGIYCPGRLLFAQGPVATALTTDATAFNTAMTSREVRRIARRPILTHDSSCMSYCMGMDNSVVLPPFMPQGRNEDGVFGTMLAFCDRRALFGHLAVGVIHDSDRPANYDETFTFSARHTRVSELMRYLTRVTSMAPGLAPADRLTRLGAFLTDIAGLAPRDFEVFVRELILRFRTDELRQLVQFAASGSRPEWWRTAVAEYLRAFRRSGTRRDFVIPAEFTNAHGSPSESLEHTRQFVGHFGELLRAWPDMWNHLRAMNAPTD